MTRNVRDETESYVVHFKPSSRASRPTMRRGKSAAEQLEAEKLDAVESWLDNLDPDEMEVIDPVELRRIGFAQRAMRTAEEELRVAVGGARIAGHSWAAIGRTLGISRQAAHERFGGDAGEFKSSIYRLLRSRWTHNGRESLLEHAFGDWLRRGAAPDALDAEVTVVARNRTFVAYSEPGSGGDETVLLADADADADLDMARDARARYGSQVGGASSNKNLPL